MIGNWRRNDKIVGKKSLKEGRQEVSDRGREGRRENRDGPEEVEETERLHDNSNKRPLVSSEQKVQRAFSSVRACDKWENERNAAP